MTLFQWVLLGAGSVAAVAPAVLWMSGAFVETVRHADQILAASAAIAALCCFGLVLLDRAMFALTGVYPRTAEVFLGVWVLTFFLLVLPARIIVPGLRRKRGWPPTLHSNLPDEEPRDPQSSQPSR